MTPVNVCDFPVAWRIATSCIHNVVWYKYTIHACWNYSLISSLAEDTLVKQKQKKK